MRPPNGGEKWHHERRRIEYLCTDIVGLVFAMVVVAIFGFDIHLGSGFPHLCHLEASNYSHSSHSMYGIHFPFDNDSHFFLSAENESV